MPVQRPDDFQLADKDLDLFLIALDDGPLIGGQRDFFQEPADLRLALQRLAMRAGLG